MLTTNYHVLNKNLRADADCILQAAIFGEIRYG